MYWPFRFGSTGSAPPSRDDDLGALGSGIGYTEVASVWVTGKLWMKVPTTIKLTLSGRFAAGVSAKDLMLHLIGSLGADGCGYKSVEFYGSALPAMTISERMTMRPWRWVSAT